MKKKITPKSALCELTIRSLGVIDNAEIEFKPGLTVITGETGAGKTMVLTALNLILGGKSDVDFIRTGEERLTVSGRFAIGKDIQAVVENAGGVVEENQVIINRSLTNQGKSKISLGGAAISLSQVSELAEELIEIHAQASSARLSKPAIQAELLDAFGDYENLLIQYSEKFSEYQNLRKRISELETQMKVREKEIAKYEAIAEDFSKVSPKSGELSLTENEITKLGAVEEIASGIAAGLGAINDEDNSALSALAISKKLLETLKGKDTELDELIDLHSEGIYEIIDVVSKIERYLSSLEADPERFNFLQLRKAELLGLIKKYGSGTDREAAFENLISLADDAQSKLSDLRGGDVRLEELVKEIEVLFNDLKSVALKLSKSRIEAARNLSEAITYELASLALPNATLSVDVKSKDFSDSKNYSTSGLDEVTFLFTSHKEGKLLPLSKAASGGELSRVMLAIEVVLAKNSKVGTYIFDEVDAGVGGKAAIEVGKRLALLAVDSQVIVVTHLAQVASWADNHLVVSKSDTGSVTQSNIIEVTGNERRKEIARLLSGQDESISAQEHAGELLDLVAKSRIEMIG